MKKILIGTLISLAMTASLGACSGDGDDPIVDETSKQTTITKLSNGVTRFCDGEIAVYRLGDGEGNANGTKTAIAISTERAPEYCPDQED